MNQQEIIEQLKLLIKQFASKETSVTVEFFNIKRATIFQIIRLILPPEELNEISLEALYDIAVKEYKSVYPIDIDPSSSLTRAGLETWLTEERKKIISDKYLTRYLKFLRKEGRSDAVISELSRSSESILSKLGDPESSSSFYRKGLVVGSVQSGKTGNFNAVVNRAIDSGYNLIIILSGIMEDLRGQTQARIEKEVVGEGTNLKTEQYDPRLGVGAIERFGIQGTKDVVQVIRITSYQSDFNRNLLDASVSLNQKNILVCKKNTGILKNLLIWLSEYLDEYKEQHNIPLLIIDDEADNASLNNLGHLGREYGSVINWSIRSILKLFSRKTYLGYTATPFANVIQDRNDEPEGQWTINFKRNGEVFSKTFSQVPNIFPDDFIELLDTPSNYIGAKQIFETTTDPETRKIPLVEVVEDHFLSFPQKLIDTPNGPRPATQDEIDTGLPGIRSSRKDDLFPQYLPSSLIDAIKCFIISTAIRIKRKPHIAGSKLFNPHDTMLIHISRFTDWQNRTKDLVQIELTHLANRISNELPSSADSIYAELEKIWNQYFAAIVETIQVYLPEGYSDDFMFPVKFSEIKSLIPEAIKGIEVIAINSSPIGGKLRYKTDSKGNGKKYIAVGGNRLSRGFTLEGLTINYFVRSTNYADTLLQMGRWFGYRPGYLDCCKLFTTWDSIQKFDAATRTIEELEVEFKKMHRLGKSPLDFVLRVRDHPGVLKITRPSILKNAEEINWSYQDTLQQTTRFKLSETRLASSWKDLKKLISENSGSFKMQNGFYVIETDSNGLFSFLNISNSFHDFGSELEQIKAFIRLCNEKKKLRRWKIAIKATGSADYLPPDETGLPGVVQMSVRRGPEKEGRHRKELLDHKVFTGSGKSANILSGGRDMSLWLSDEEIESAERDFFNAKTKEIVDKGDFSVEQAELIAMKKNPPEGIYRERMTDQQGLLVIYLMDMRNVLPKEDEKLSEIKLSEGIDEKIPLIGYAIGFPPIKEQIGGRYVKGKYNIDEDEPESDEFDESLLNNEEAL